jgi:hypothetical protein
MLAQNNVSAGRVVTKMQFDTKTKYAKVLFSPASAVAPEDYEVIKSQGKSSSAENAVKLTVYKQDGGAPALEAPEVPAAVLLEAAEPEPVKRESKPKPAAGADDGVADIVKKWSKKE